MKRIFIADEQPLTRQSVRTILTAEEHEIVGESADGRETLQLALKLQPDLLILDLALSRKGGLEVIRELRQRHSPTRTLVLTAQNSEHFAGLALQAGAFGFVDKQGSLDDLADAVRTVLRGRSYFPARALSHCEPETLGKSEAQQLASLSPREMTVLRYLAMGRSNKQISAELDISHSSISTYKTRLRQKLNASSLAELLEIAWRSNLTSQPRAAPESADGAPERPIAEVFHEQFDGVPVAISLRDGEGRLIACNRQYLLLQELDEAIATGQRIIDTPSLEPEQALAYHQNYLNAYALGKSYGRDVVLHYHHRIRILRIHGSPYYDSTGKMIGMLCTSIDLTEHENRLLALSEAKRQLESARRTQARLNLALGHSLRECLGRTREQLVDPQADMPRALAALDILEARLDAVLDMSRLNTEDEPMTPAATDLARLTGSLAPGAEENVEYRQRDPAAEPALVWIDAQAYRKIVRGMLVHCCNQGATRVLLESDLGALSAAEIRWRLAATILASDRERAERTADPRITLAARLAQAMGGNLELLPEDAAQPGAVLELRLYRAQA